MLAGAPRALLRAFALRPPSAPGLALPFPGEIVDLVCVNVEHDLPAPSILISDDELCALSVLDLGAR
jgi:hypothetical protein